MSGRKDISGQRYGRLTAMYLSKIDENGASVWRCVCDCGNEVDVTVSRLTTGNTRSCGCLHKERVSEGAKIAHTKHGKHGSRLYFVWKNMKGRCNNSNRKDYYRYGGRGIAVCAEWSDNYDMFYEWAMKNGYADDLTLDRIDVDKDYCPENCRWTNMKNQCNNTSRNRMLTYKGRTQTVAQWASEMNINYYTLWNRVKRGVHEDELFEKKRL